MKKTLLIVIICVALLASGSVSAFAGTPASPDTTPPVVWGFGISATAVKTVGCEGNFAIQIQTKASDLNGIPLVKVQYKRPGDTKWQTYPMTLKPDGYWRYYISKGRFTFGYVGMWKIRVVAYDTFKNLTISGAKSLEVSTCPQIAS